MLAPIAREVRIIELPAAVPIKGDVSSLIDAGWTRKRIAKLIERAPKYEASQARPPIVEDSEQFQIVAVTWREMIGRWHQKYGSKLVLARDLFPIAGRIEFFPLRGERERQQRLAFGQ